ncbi:hypothetical protein [Rhodopila sp.]|uniref:hypothetical protein n=1 Tax=Rhodopila sp. TaxID=2480087 RepID=UPI003D0D2923
MTSMLGILIGSFISLIIAAFVMSSTPLQITSIRPQITYRAHDSVLEMHYKFVSRRQCNSVISTWIWRWVEGDGLAQRQRYFIPIGTAFVTLADPSPVMQEFTIARHLPAEVTPGQWFLRAKSLDRCGFLAQLFDPVTRVTADMPVTVLEQEANEHARAGQ